MGLCGGKIITYENYIKTDQHYFLKVVSGVITLFLTNDHTYKTLFIFFITLQGIKLWRVL